MRYFPVFLLMFAVFSCNTGNESFDDSSLLLSILDNQTERYRRIVDYSNKIDTTYLVARDGLVVNSLIESSRFILQNDLKSDEKFLVDTVPGLKTLDSLKIIETNSEYLTRGELITLQFDALQNAFGKLSLNKFNIINTGYVSVDKTKPKYTHRREDSIKIHLDLYDRYQYFTHQYSFNQGDTTESIYEDENYIKLDVEKKGVNILKGKVIFTNGVKYEIPYEFEYIVK